MPSTLFIREGLRYDGYIDNNTFHILYKNKAFELKPCFPLSLWINRQHNPCGKYLNRNLFIIDFDHTFTNTQDHTF